MYTLRMHAKFPQKNVRQNITEKLGTDGKIILKRRHRRVKWFESIKMVHSV